MTAASSPIIICGIAGSGKSTLAAALADHLHWQFVEGDDLHPPANRARMAAGQPLTDADRWPWLDRIAAQLAAWSATRRPGVISCSALRRRYRDRLRDAVPVRFVFLDIGAERAEARIARRAGHFMPASLVASQLATLERPSPDEAITIAADLPLNMQLAAVIAALD